MTGTTIDGSEARHQRDAAVRPLLPPPPKLRRRPGAMAAGVLVICAGALLGAWAWTSATDTAEVLALRNDVPRGSLIEADDLQRVRITVDPALDPVAGSAYDNIVGQYAVVDLPEGGILTSGSTAAEASPPDGTSVVGIALTPGQAPAVPFQQGDAVRIVVTPAKGEVATSQLPQMSDAMVVASHIDDATGQHVLDVVVPHAEAAILAARVATGNVAVVLDSGAR